MKSNRSHTRADYEIRDPGLERARAALAGELERRRHLSTLAATAAPLASGGRTASLSASRRRLDTLLCEARLRVRALHGAVRHRVRRRAAIRELERLPDRLLADIGVPRGRIVELVDGMLAKEQAPATLRTAPPAPETRWAQQQSQPTRAAA